MRVKFFFKFCAITKDVFSGGADMPGVCKSLSHSGSQLEVILSQRTFLSIMILGRGCSRVHTRHSANHPANKVALIEEELFSPKYHLHWLVHSTRLFSRMFIHYSYSPDWSF